MFNNIFGVPFWIKDIEPEKLGLVSKNFKRNWFSKTPSSFSEDPTNNTMSKEGVEYLKDKLIKCLNDVGVEEIKKIQIWRNIYKNDFQELHMHVNSQFSFTIYEKISKPQTIFYNPAHDMMYATNVDKYLKTVYEPEVKEKQMVVFPSYLQHMVRKTDEAITISGNIFLI